MTVLEIVGLLSEGIGGSDCEELRDEALAQPVNAITSFSYVVIGVAVMARAAQRRRSLVESLVFGTCLVGVGLGSVLFHGPQPAGSRILHDLPILLTVLFIVAHDLALLSPRFRRPMAWFAGSVVVATALTIADQDLGGVVTGLGVGAIAVLEFLIYRRRLRATPTRRHGRAYLAIIGVTGLAAATYLLGRTDSPTCDPDALFQFHALWHVLSAIVFGLWWWLAYDGDDTSAVDDDLTVATTTR